jgi:hypothetical protein
MKGSQRWLLLGALTIALSGCGFTGNLRMNPGFASFRTPSTLPGADRQLGISVGPVPLRLATMVSRVVIREEPWIPDMLSDVRAVRVYFYDVARDGGRVTEHMEETRGELVADGWQQIVVVREDGGLACALVMPKDEEALSGLVVMFEDETELVLVNVIGNIEPSTFNTLMTGLDIDAPLLDMS